MTQNYNFTQTTKRHSPEAHVVEFSNGTKQEWLQNFPFQLSCLSNVEANNPFTVNSTKCFLCSFKEARLFVQQDYQCQRTQHYSSSWKVRILGLNFSTFIVFIILGPRVGVAKDFLVNLARLEVDFGYTMVVAPFWIPNRLS
jgi:hypothetical protein